MNLGSALQTLAGTTARRAQLEAGGDGLPRGAGDDPRARAARLGEDPGEPWRRTPESSAGAKARRPAGAGGGSSSASAGDDPRAGAARLGAGHWQPGSGARALAERTSDATIARQAVDQITAAEVAMRAVGHVPNANYYAAQLSAAAALVAKLTDQREVGVMRIVSRCNRVPEAVAIRLARPPSRGDHARVVKAATERRRRHHMADTKIRSFVSAQSGRRPRRRVTIGGVAHVHGRRERVGQTRRQGVEGRRNARLSRQSPRAQPDPGNERHRLPDRRRNPTPYQAGMLDAMTRRLQEIDRVAMVINTSGDSGGVEAALSPDAELSGRCDDRDFRHAAGLARRYVPAERPARHPHKPQRPAPGTTGHHLRRRWPRRARRCTCSTAGCRRIAVVIVDGGNAEPGRPRARLSPRRRRSAGFQASVVRAGPTGYAAGFEAGRMLLSGSRRPDGAFCVTDLLACGFMDAARARVRARRAGGPLRDRLRRHRAGRLGGLQPHHLPPADRRDRRAHHDPRHRPGRGRAELL